MINEIKRMGVKGKVNVISMRNKLRGIGGKVAVTPEGVLVDGKMVLPADRVMDFLRGQFEMKLPEKKIEAKVGVMSVTVKAGKDGKLGTDDDEVSISSEGKWDYEELDEGGFKCRYCGKVLKSKRGITKHVDNRVCRK